MNDFYTQITRPNSTAKAATFDAGLRAYMLKIYNYMGSALAITGIVALLAVQSPAFLNAMYVMEGSAIAGMKPLAWIIMLAPLGMAMWMGFALNKMSLGAARAGFWGFAVVMGLSLTTIFLTYTGTSIARVFFITASTFGAMSIYGYTTQRDLTKFGSFLVMGVIGIMIASLVNLFLQSSALQFGLSVICVLVFTGLTAYDTQKLKHLYYELQLEGEAMAKTVIMGALTLYLDFINIFTSLMHLLGDRRQ
ncbi:MAG: Bax inhibitor-1/YccA family protein [Alphaproteobacteria bacterium]|nr:Bax inhibitor-1/YccA family protein [Alphaproteobacteria bacterium]